ncbi:hypothetical protein P3T76_015391 [Phytophthora citrophthora]|uniref:RxLR effector protein n=1 Tax=Phytophthora citrophthora TaxID=4793 RepID=A0AAD9G003_9STRA|nr:hypothetical protein P3T76_015391 [Phytophthora citrophthora]
MKIRFFLLVLATIDATSNAFSISAVEAFVQGRNLRGFKTNDEERALGLSRMSVEKLENILTDTDGFQLVKFGKWQTKKVLPKDVTEAIRRFSPHDKRYWAIGLMYSNFLKGIKPTVSYSRLDDETLAKLSQQIANSRLVHVPESVPTPSWSELYTAVSDILRKKAASYFQPSS